MPSEMMPAAEFRRAQATMGLIGGLSKSIDWDLYVSGVGYAETVAPFIDPTAYIRSPHELRQLTTEMARLLAKYQGLYRKCEAELNRQVERIVHLEPINEGWSVHFVAERGFAKKTLPVAALTFGPLLVHVSAPGNQDIPGWTISHEATGGRILAAHSLAQAEHLALALTQDFAWGFTTLAEFKARRVEIRDAIQAALKNSGETWKFDGNTFSVEPPPMPEDNR